MDRFCYLCFMSIFVMLSCLFLAALWPLGSLVCCDFLCFVTFPYDVPSQVWYLIVLIPDLCFPLSFSNALVWENLEKKIFVTAEANPILICFT